MASKNKVVYPFELSVTQNIDAGHLLVRQSDDNTQVFEVKLVDKHKTRSFEGLTPFFCLFPRGTTGQGLTEEPVQEFDDKKGTFSYTLSPNSWQYVGRNEAYFSFRKQLENGTWDEQYSTKMFTYQVEKSIYQVKFFDSNYWWTFKELMQQFKNWIDSSKNYWNNFVESSRDVIEKIENGGIVTEIVDTRDGNATMNQMVDKKIGLKSEFREVNKYDSYMKRVERESKEMHVMLSHLGVNGDGTFNNGPLLQSIIDKYDPSKNVLLNGNIANIILRLPQGVFYTGNTQLRLPNGVKLKGYANRKWTNAKILTENDIFQNGATIIYSELDKETDVVIKCSGLLADGSIPKQYTETDISIVGLGNFLVDNTGISNLSIVSKNKKGIGINALNTILSEFSDISIFNFDYNFIGSAMWNTKINRLHSFGHQKNGIYLEGYGGGMEISGISVSSNSGLQNFTNILKLRGLDRGKYPLKPCGITIVGMTSLKIDQFTVENSPLGVRVVDSTLVTLDTLHSEVCTHGMFDIDNSSVEIRNYFDYQQPNSSSTIFNLRNNAKVEADFVRLVNYYQHVFNIDTTSKLKIKNSNVQQAIVSNKNVTIFRQDDEIESDIDFSLNLAAYDGTNSTNHKYSSKKGSYVKAGRTIVYDLNATISSWDTTAKDGGRLRVGVDGTGNYGMLQVVLSGLKSGETGDNSIIAFAEFDNFSSADVKYAKGFLETTIAKKYSKIRVSGSLITNF